MIVTWSHPLIERVPIRDSGEPLVDVGTAAPLRVARPETYLRYGVVDRLVTAQSLLPRAVRLLIVDGHRPAAQRCQHVTCALEEAADTATCTTPPAVAPHPTGGAVDLTLFDDHLPAVVPECCVGVVPPPSARTRQLLTSA